MSVKGNKAIILLGIGIIVMHTYDTYCLDQRITKLEQQPKAIEKIVKTEEKEPLNIEETGQVYTLDRADRDYIERVVAAEARGTSLNEMMAVAQTIKDRSELWNMTLTEVLNQPYQYAEPYSGDVSDTVKLAVSNVFDKGERVFSAPTTHFHNDTVSPYWTADKECRGKIDRTTFYY